MSLLNASTLDALFGSREAGLSASHGHGSWERVDDRYFQNMRGARQEDVVHHMLKKLNEKIEELEHTISNLNDRIDTIEFFSEGEKVG
jgi:hypothetical protein